MSDYNKFKAKLARDCMKRLGKRSKTVKMICATCGEPIVGDVLWPHLCQKCHDDPLRRDDDPV